ncbi:MAG TPA: ribosome recycling factor [Planctomycetota bacterium]|nr:ribosome recycling factor [Planctomycetota bacterium]
MNEDQILKEAKGHFDKSLQHVQEQLRGIRTGRASSALVDNVRVDYYGTPTPVSQLASVSIPEPRQIQIKPFDPSILKELAKAIAKSDLGASPQDDGKVVRINLPPLSGDQRQKFAGKVKELCEEARVAMRNSRRDANKHADQANKQGTVTDDAHRRIQTKIQELLKDYEKKVDEVHDKKVAEIME